MSGMTPGERVRAAVNGEHLDRVPLCFWHHFRPEGSGARLAAMTVEFFQEKFHLDILKIMPDLPNPEPATTITASEQLRSLPRLGLDTPAFREQLLCIRTIRERVGDDYPLLLTLFSPLTYAMLFMGRDKAAVGKARMLETARQHPAALEEGLGIIAENLRQLMAAAIDAGASGIFFSCMGATSADFTPEEYQRFGRPYDLQALAGARGGWLNTVHIHADPDQSGDQIYFNQFTDYPVSVISWSDRVTEPTLSEAFTLTDKCLMGGLWERGPLTHGSEVELDNEMMSAISQTKGRKFILANGCSIPDDTADEWLYRARHLVDDLH